MRKGFGFTATLAALVVAVACNTAPKTDSTTPRAAQQDHPVDDALITMTVQSKYFGSSDVKGRDINVDTDHGVVTLRGKVDSEAAHQKAVELAKNTDGVTRVDDRLAMDAESRTARSGQPEAKSPAWITAKIQSQYYLHPGLKPWNIDVTTNGNGIVTLTGLVDNTADRDEAVMIARKTDGVTGLSDHLRVKGETAATTGTVDKAAGTVSDSWITGKIQARYFLDDAVKGREINVDTKDGVVTLRGTVDSYSERLAAASIARNTDGVKEVRDELSVGAPAKANDTIAKEKAKVRDTVGTAGQKIEDGWITTKIQSKFFMDDQIKSRTVDVDTKNGVVTLSGTVPNEAAHKAAEDLAKETDGVVRVVNRLRVEPSK
jgi:osmotically-inducible protein OsmY